MLLGIAALRAGQGTKVLYDGANMKITNIPTMVTIPSGRLRPDSTKATPLRTPSQHKTASIPATIALVKPESRSADGTNDEPDAGYAGGTHGP